MFSFVYGRRDLGPVKFKGQDLVLGLVGRSGTEIMGDKPGPWVKSSVLGCHWICLGGRLPG